MTDQSITPVILSGGSGTRLWPMSRPERPKQLLALTGDKTMLQQTALRTAGEGFAAPILVANARHAELIEAQLAEMGITPAALILEPAPRNTAPAIALAALEAGERELLLVMPSDHVILDEAAFLRAVDDARPVAEAGWLVTFGIAPEGPETGYGYIRRGEALDAGVHKVARFIEKPDRAAAQAMLASGGYSWNGGIFLFRADIFLGALAVHAPDILHAAQQAMAAAKRDSGRIHPDAAAFAASPSDSIDYAVMEKAERVAVAPVSMGWSDVGSWDALHALAERDADGNAHHGDVVAIDSANCLVRSDGPRVSLLGVADLIVVVSGNDVMIAPRARAQDVKKLAEASALRD